jgi:hypothetical protein
MSETFSQNESIESKHATVKCNISFRWTDDVIRFLENFPLSQHVHLRELTIQRQWDSAVLIHKDHDHRTGAEKALKQFARRNLQVLFRELIKYGRADKRACLILFRASMMQMLIIAVTISS